MKRDSIYYQIFKHFPRLLFELVDNPPLQGQNYRFESVEVKETAFRMDGVFLPPEDATSRAIAPKYDRLRYAYLKFRS